MTRDIIREIEGLTSKQREVLGFVAINEDEGQPQRTLDGLHKLGLIEPEKVPMPGWPGATMTQWYTPAAVHKAWCYWCSENEGDG